MELQLSWREFLLLLPPPILKSRRYSETKNDKMELQEKKLLRIKEARKHFFFLEDRNGCINVCYVVNFIIDFKKCYFSC